MKYTLLLILSILIFIGCNNKNTSSERAQIHDNFGLTKDSNSIYILNKGLEEEVNKFIKRLDSLGMGNDSIIGINIYNKNNDCFLLMYIQPFYDSKQSLGYMMFNNIMLAFNKVKPNCNYRLVNTQLLRRNPVNKFNDNKMRRKYGAYDPWGNLYIINGDSSLRLINSGFL